ncbi:MAG: site-specific integrase [Phycisphaerales bacterium]|nr:site-specific integrase [Phycisphaerales bacterium]
MPRRTARGEPPIFTNAGRRFPPEVLTDAEVRALLAACGDGTPTHARNRALIAVLYRGGLRVSEALALYPKDLDPATGAVRVLWAKGGRARTIGLDPGAFRLVGEWLRLRAGTGLDARYPLFCTPRGRAVSSSYIRRLLNRLGEQAGIQKRVHPHGLRHTHAAQLRAEGVDIGIISKQLGHRSIATTARYLDHIAPWAVVEAIRGREW